MIQLVITVMWINSGRTNGRLIVCQQLQAAMFLHPQLEHISVLIAHMVEKVYLQKKWHLGACHSQKNLICLVSLQVAYFVQWQKAHKRNNFHHRRGYLKLTKTNLSFVGKILPEELIKFLTVECLNLAVHLSCSYIYYIAVLSSLVFSIVFLESHLLEAVSGRKKSYSLMNRSCASYVTCITNFSW